MDSPKFDPAGQKTVGWIKARQGCLTASRMADAMDKTAKGLDSAKRAGLKIEVVAERLTECSVSHPVNAAMKHGIYWEARAREAYEAKQGEFVTECGFVTHADIPYFGASPDGLVGDDGLVEIKCPTITTHVKYLMAPAMPTDYIPQMLAQLAVTRRKWCDFVSFYPGVSDTEDISDPNELAFYGAITVPDSHKLKVWRFLPKPEEIAAVEDAARGFLAEVDAIFDKVVLNS